MVDGCVQSVPGLCVLCVHACVRCEQLLLSDMAAACFCAGVRCGAQPTAKATARVAISK